MNDKIPDIMKQTKVTTFEEEFWSQPTDNAIEFIKYWQDKINEIPEEFRCNAEIEIDVRDSYGLGVIDVEVSYLRPETNEEEEIRTRLQKQAQDKANKHQEVKEITELRRLREKYPDFK